ncbi:MAG TPA: hypothetical protein VFR97_01245 [Capillimicrobium sp.]|nr:hypothetical protein [Capillimicrobium sp.]
MSKVTSFARSPQGQRAMAEAKRLARDPKTRKQIDDVRRRLMSRGRKTA